MSNFHRQLYKEEIYFTIKYSISVIVNYELRIGEIQNIEETHFYTVLTVADCLTDEDITTGLMDMFAKLMLKKLITKNSEKINPIWVNARF